MCDEKKLFLDDLSEGQRFDLGVVALSDEEIIEFARLYDPQDFHLSEEAAKPVFGGLAASGWQTACLYQRLLVQGFLSKVVCLGGAGLEHLRFVKPALADVNMSGSATVIESRVSKTKPQMGLVKLQCEMANSAGDVILSMVAMVLIATRQ